MKKTTMTVAMLIMAFFFYTASMLAEEVKIQTNAHCASCKTKIEKGLKNKAGIQQSSVNMDDKVCTIKYDAAKTNPEKLVKSISDLGYTASLVGGGEVAKTQSTEAKADCCKGKDKKDCCKTTGKACSTSGKSCTTGSKSCTKDKECSTKSAK